MRVTRLAPLLIAAALQPALAGAPELAEEAVLDRIGARDLSAARAGVLALRPSALEPARARRVDLLELGVALAELEAAAPDRAAGQRRALLSRLDRLRARLAPQDLLLLQGLEAALGPTGAVYLAPLRRAVRGAIGPRQPRSLLMDLARDPDLELRRLAVSALASQLAPFRARVLAGEDLTPSEQRALSNPELIRLLVERLPDATGGDPLAPDLSAATAGAATALHGLVLIEAPALPALRAGLDRPGVREAIQAIERAIEARLRGLPRSTWCSASGKIPVSGARVTCQAPRKDADPGAPPRPCGAVLPPGARHCPDCGQRVRTSCPGCLMTLEVGAAWCPGCGAGAKPDARAPTCPACRAALATPGRFCPECGAELRADREE